MDARVRADLYQVNRPDNRYYVGVFGTRVMY